MNKKAVSPIIATLLLVVIAVAAAVITYVWITGYLGTLQQQSGAQQVQERIKIDGVKISDDTVTVYIRNIGDVQVKIAAVYVLDETGSIIGETRSLSNTVTAGNSITIPLTVPGLSNGKTYVVKAITEKGVEATYQFVYRE